MLEHRKAVVRRWIHEVWDNGNMAIFDEFGDPDYVYTAPGIGPLRGKAQLAKFLQDFRPAIPDRHNTIDEQIAEGDTVVTRGTTRGTHKGMWNGLHPTGRPIEVPWIMITRFRGDKILEEYEVYDSLTMMEQMGAVKRIDVPQATVS